MSIASFLRAFDCGGGMQLSCNYLFLLAHRTEGHHLVASHLVC